MFEYIIKQVYFSNTIKDYLISLGILILLTIIIKLANFFILKYLSSLSMKTSTKLDDFFIRTLDSKIVPLLYFGSFYAAVSRLVLAPALVKTVNFLGLALLALYGASFASTVIIYLLQLYWTRKGKKPAQDYILKIITKLIQILIWTFAVITLLDNFIEIDALIAGLGIGGIAIGFAAQAILQDIFSYFSIFLDRPFEIGDFIVIGEYKGTVEHIGLKTTRLRSINGEQLIFSNGDLTSSRVSNFKRMDTRRIVFSLGVTYDTSSEKLKAIPDIIKNIINEQKDILLDRVHFSSFGDFSLKFEAVYFVNNSDFNKYMDIQQEINYRVKEAFEKQGIEFAYPTHTLFVNKPRS